MNNYMTKVGLKLATTVNKNPGKEMLDGSFVALQVLASRIQLLLMSKQEYI